MRQQVVKRDKSSDDDDEEEQLRRLIADKKVTKGNPPQLVEKKAVLSRQSNNWPTAADTDDDEEEELKKLLGCAPDSQKKSAAPSVASRETKPMQPPPGFERLHRLPPVDTVVLLPAIAPTESTSALSGSTTVAKPVSYVTDVSLHFLQLRRIFGRGRSRLAAPPSADALGTSRQ